MVCVSQYFLVVMSVYFLTQLGLYFLPLCTFQDHVHDPLGGVHGLDLKTVSIKVSRRRGPSKKLGNPVKDRINIEPRLQSLLWGTSLMLYVMSNVGPPSGGQLQSQTNELIIETVNKTSKTAGNSQASILRS